MFTEKFRPWAQLYQRDTNFAIEVRMTAALAFVPLDRVTENFEQLHEHFSDAVTPVLDYFEDNFVGDHSSLCRICGLCTRELMRSFRQLIFQLKAGIAVFRLTLVATIQILAIFELPDERRCSS
jgi:hypothetical protein